MLLCAATIACVFILVPETKGKTLEEVIDAKGVVYHEDVMVNKMFTKLSARKGRCDIYWIRGKWVKFFILVLVKEIDFKTKSVEKKKPKHKDDEKNPKKDKEKKKKESEREDENADKKEKKKDDGGETNEGDKVLGPGSGIVRFKSSPKVSVYGGSPTTTIAKSSENRKVETPEEKREYGEPEESSLTLGNLGWDSCCGSLQCLDQLFFPTAERIVVPVKY
ncbi:uncharacterized protein LOC110885992 isoform X1 [Helianthus annuus]|uniref:uncharacterized protein LOC110885992 isoform X1 n=1 Tax=Helianthus annuus TaxID=4232 RepID=UPI0016531B9F|nr:uncharacterized protein LOC110885992 isoform X1 [Helianthus annuus]XP_035834572.1 uncharacterized protein LOC110885992 isoform X1 [Helianthus annuus]XP_035834573.1 uncharacterized protein LOC110885992 isoform X1 [Helianthus annuus]XP_035834574.1 uncharacterized protein LOC110885992 isoform X1 [Helianthus annuus]XP_035834575.1 uncharacterized protein LOC110885992 isoform X1 [Helianthus annuus]XP_035834576.1 uncharacterized protein LOC110885992 isoform X1 [Helianthus annuus]